MNVYKLQGSNLLPGFGGYGGVQGDNRPSGIFSLFLQTFHNIGFIQSLYNNYVHMFRNSIITV